MKKLLLLALLLVLGGKAQAIVIEGQTPQGTFQAVGLDTQGDFLVAVSSVIPYHVVVDSGSTTNITVSQSSSTSSGVKNMALTPFLIMPVRFNRNQVIVCNNDAGINLWVGPASVALGAGFLMTPGSCLSPDVPTSFVGALYGISSATALGTVSWISFY
jgi:hypothetical protein